MCPVPRPHPKEFRDDVVAIARQGETPIKQVAKDFTVLASGAVEIALGSSFVVLSRWRVAVGLAVAAFFVVIFPGNIARWVEHKDGFGLDTDEKRFGRLFFQPVLVAWALWSTGALRAVRGTQDRG